MDSCGSTARPAATACSLREDASAADSRIIPAADVKGCRPQAERQVRLRIPRYDPAIQPYLEANQISRHPAVAVARARWTQCMATAGIPVADSNELQVRLAQLRDAVKRQAMTAGRARIEESQLASADVTCYIQRVHPVERALQATLLERMTQRLPTSAEPIRVALSTG